MTNQRQSILCSYNETESSNCPLSWQHMNNIKMKHGMTWAGNLFMLLTSWHSTMTTVMHCKLGKLDGDSHQPITREVASNPFKSLSFAQYNRHLILVPKGQHQSKFILCFLTAWWTPTLSCSNINFPLNFNQAICKKPKECAPTQITKNAWLMCFKYHKHCATDHQNAAHGICSTQTSMPWSPRTTSTTASLAHPSEVYVQTTVKEYEATEILRVFPIRILGTDHC